MRNIIKKKNYAGSIAQITGNKSINNLRMYPISHIKCQLSINKSSDAALVHKTKGRRQNTRGLTYLQYFFN